MVLYNWSGAKTKKTKSNSSQILERKWIRIYYRPTQPSIPLGSVNKDQFWMGMQRRVGFIQFVDKCVCRRHRDPLIMDATPECL